MMKTWVLPILLLLMVGTVCAANVRLGALYTSGGLTLNTLMFINPAQYGYYGAGAFSNVNISNTVAARCDIGLQYGVAFALHYTRSGTEYTDYLCYKNGLTDPLNDLEPSTSYTVQESGFIGMISAADVNADGRDELVSRTGIYDLKNQAVITKFSNPLNDPSTVEVVDLTSDYFADILRMNATRILTAQSIGGDIIPAGNLSASRLSCTIDYASRQIRGTFIDLKSPSSANTVYLARLKSGGSVLQTKSYQPSTTSPLFTFDIATANEYTIEATASIDSGEHGGEYVTLSCNQTATAAITLLQNQKCNLGVDADFNYFDSVRNHGWVLTTTSEPGLDGTSALMRVANTKMTHGLGGCLDPVFNLDMSLKRVGSRSLTHVRVFAKMENGEIAPIGDFGLIDSAADTSSNMFIFDGPASRAVPVKGIGNSTKITDTEFHTVHIEFNTVQNDVVTNTYTVFMDGSSTGTSATFMNSNAKGVVAVQVESTTASEVDVDYIKTYGSAGEKVVTRTAEQTAEQQAREYLTRCNASGDRDFNVTPVRTARTTAIELDRQMQNVASYCDALYRSGVTDTTYCSVKYLQRAIKYNSNCYKEVYDYCVVHTYPESGAFNEDPDTTLRDQTNGLDGAAACSFSLMLTVGTDKVALPMWQSIWFTIKSNVIFAIVIILVIAFAIGSRRRRE